MLPSRRRLVRPAVDDDFVMSKRMYWHVLVLPSRSLVRPAADDDFVMPKRMYGHVLVLPSRIIVRPAADDDFGKGTCVCSPELDCVPRELEKGTKKHSNASKIFFEFHRPSMINLCYSKQAHGETSEKKC